MVKEKSAKMGKISAGEVRSRIALEVMLFSHAIGEGCRSVFEDTEFGEDVLDAITEYSAQWEMPAGEVVRLARFARNVAVEFVSANAGRQCRNGEVLSNEHWMVISEFASEADQRKLLQKILRGSLSVADAQKALHVQQVARDAKSSLSAANTLCPQK